MQIKSRFYSGAIALPKKMINEKFNESFAIKYKLGYQQFISKISNVKRKTRAGDRYCIAISRKYEFREGSGSIVLDILDLKKLGYKPLPQLMEGQLDTITLMDNRFTCFEKNETILDLYYLNHKAACRRLIPRMINVDNKLLLSLGLYLTDGHKSKNRLSISNNEFEVINIFLDYIKNVWLVNEEEIHYEVKIRDGVDIEKIKSYWSEKINIDRSRVNVRRVLKKPPKAEFGNMEIIVYDTILANLHLCLLVKLKDLIKNGNLLLAFLNGVEAGDGYAIQHGTSIEIGFSIENKFVSLIAELCEKAIGKKPRIEKYHTSDRAYKIIYRGLKTAEVFLLNDHFKYHKRRRKNLIDLVRKFRKRDIKYLNALCKGLNNVKEIALFSHVTYRAANLMIRKFIRECIVSYKQSKITRNSKIYKIRHLSLTERGLRLSEILIEGE